jgi:hypothetical protein
MARSFDAQDLVQLPKLTALGVLAVGTQMLQVAATEKKLPAAVGRARDALAAALVVLRDAAKDRLPTGGDADVDLRTLDVTLDAAWSSTLGLVDAWQRLPGAPAAELAAANALAASLFASGLGFTQLAYALEWGESQARLDLVAARKLDARFEALGASAFLAVIKKAHKAYGDALGMTKPKAQAAAAAPLRVPADAVQRAMRTYVVKVSAYGDDEDVAGAAATAARLLAPLAAWESAPAAKSAPNDPPAPPAPPTPPAPDPATG